MWISVCFARLGLLTRAESPCFRIAGVLALVSVGAVLVVACKGGSGNDDDNGSSGDSDPNAFPITEIIDASGAGAGKRLSRPSSLATGSGGDVYVIGDISNNVLQITPGGIITEIINASGAGAAKELDAPAGLAADAISGNVYVCGFSSDNVLMARY